MSKYFEFEDDKEFKVEPVTEPDLGDANPLLCDYCNNVLLETYEENKFRCPNCLYVYNPKFEHLKRQPQESTIEDDSDINSGELSFVEDERQTIRKSKIRSSLDKDSIPEYVKKEFEFATTRTGYKQVPIDKKLMGSES